MSLQEKKTFRPKFSLTMTRLIGYICSVITVADINTNNACCVATAVEITEWVTKPSKNLCAFVVSF